MVKEVIRLSKSSISQSEKDAVMGVLDREFLGMGPEVFEFEKNLYEYIGREGVCVSSGTAALQLAIQACEIGIGDEVLVPSLTYVASFQAISATGAIPIACDIDPNSLIIDIDDAKSRMTSNTKALMPVFYGGGISGIDRINEFARLNNLRVIEDAAHAFGTTHKGKKIGSFGDITCFSFDGIKNITSGEGGAVFTDDKDVLEKIKDIRLLGVQKDSEKRKKLQRSWDFDVEEQGWRYHMSSIMAAIGIEQLKRFENLSKTRQNLAKHYSLILNSHLNIKIIDNNYDEVVPHIYPVLIEGLKHRDRLRELMLKQGIQTGIHWKPNHLLSKFFKSGIKKLPQTELIFESLLTLPLNADMSLGDVEYVCEMLAKNLKNNEF